MVSGWWRFLFQAILLLPLSLQGCSSTRDSLITGAITVESAGLEGQVDSATAWAYDTGSKVLAYISPVEGVTCQQVVDYLAAGTDPVDPGGMFMEGHCNLFLLADYDGLQQSSTWADSDLFITPWTLECTLDSGEFVYEARDGSDWDYYWSGRYWQGYPLDWTLTLSGGGGEAVMIQTEMSQYDGNFIYEVAGDDYASGSVGGSVEAAWCQEMSELSILQ